jgi:hypothetical protein
MSWRFAVWVQARLNAAVVKALDDEATRKRLLNLGCVNPWQGRSHTQALQELVEKEAARWSSVLKVAGVSGNWSAADRRVGESGSGQNLQVADWTYFVRFTPHELT